jgi:CMP-N,N'-diacetyllegionaminic acid synthase
VVDGYSVLAVVPARGGSKSIPLKNLREVGSRSLVARVGDVVSQVPGIDRAVISTDHPQIAQVAKQAGLDAPFVRPEALAGDRIGDFDVLIHALEAIEAVDNRRYDIIVMLQPTSPLRTPEHVLATIRMLIEGGWDSVWTVSVTDSKAHPLKQLTLNEKGELGYYDPRGSQVIARQQLTPVYHRNGIAYAITRDCLVSQRTTMGRRNGALVIEGEHISIDTELDIAMVEWFLAQRDSI